MRRNTTQPRARSGFTILEVLIALTATLLLMLGLTRAFKLIGDRITVSQSSLELSSTLRGVSQRLRGELTRATSPMSAPSDESAANGYLVYYEGPFSDATTVLADTPDNDIEPVPDYYRTSRFGDIDDFLAFTAQADEASPFAGFVPNGVLQAHRFGNPDASKEMTSAEKTAYTNTQAVERVPFYSSVAEIAYWLSPRWAGNAAGEIAYDGGSGYPIYADANGDQLPDRLDLHRRVLLVRPDLNMTLAEMTARNGATPPATLPSDWFVPRIPILVRSGSGLRIVPLTSSTGNQAFFDGKTSLVAPGAWSAAAGGTAPNWLTGVARVQQAMDLSVSRITDSWSAPGAATTYGQPTAVVKANSLAELSRPENRFAHVRMPEALISGGSGSTMPQLALAPPHPYLTMREDLFPAQAHLGGSGSGQFKYGRFTMVGFLRPEFNATDIVSDVAAGGSESVAVNRGGSDVIATDLLSFNVQAFDETAPVYGWIGPDGEIGSSDDDDEDGASAPDWDELGYPDSDDEFVSVDGLRGAQIVTDADGVNSSGVEAFHVVNRGAFVDLNYTRLAGGGMRGLSHPDPLHATRLQEMRGSYSGLGDTGMLFPSSWELNGRFVLRQPGGSNLVSSFYQPMFDTSTRSYAADLYDQEGFSQAPGNMYGMTPVPYPGSVDANGNPRAVHYRRWSSMQPSSSTPAFVEENEGLSTAPLLSSSVPIPVTPPIVDRLNAIRITVRAYDSQAGQIRQQTLIQEF